MANIVRLQPRDKVEKSIEFSSHSGDVYVNVFEAPAGAFTTWHIYAASPTVANFNDAPITSLLIDTADGDLWIKTGAATWASIDKT